MFLREKENNFRNLDLHKKRQSTEEGKIKIIYILFDWSKVIIDIVEIISTIYVTTQYSLHLQTYAVPIGKKSTEI